MLNKLLCPYLDLPNPKPKANSLVHQNKPVGEPTPNTLGPNRRFERVILIYLYIFYIN